MWRFCATCRGKYFRWMGSLHSLPCAAAGSFQSEMHWTHFFGRFRTNMQTDEMGKNSQFPVKEEESRNASMHLHLHSVGMLYGGTVFAGWNRTIVWSSDNVKLSFLLCFGDVDSSTTWALPIARECEREQRSSENRAIAERKRDRCWISTA